ncbi:MAG: hypothetical protein O3B90_08690 [Actinomycetota bacterium]|uniref:hypothetical protein n=1 Tax=uncultured Ilumatobacter sp. TaxID=879968 RepID=UPI00374F3910|nr:hypothetical protein [Actinomycetota bacterium]
MEISRRTWIAAVKLAVVMSTVAALAAITLASIGNVSDTTIVATVAVVAFAVSWVQTGRVRSNAAAPVNVLSHS